MSSITLRYKPEGRGFDPPWCHWNFSLTIFLVTIWPWGRLRNISWGGKGCRCVGLTTLPPLCAVMKSGSLILLEPSEPVQTCNGIALPLPFTSIRVPGLKVQPKCKGRRSQAQSNYSFEA